MYFKGHAYLEEYKYFKLLFNSGLFFFLIVTVEALDKFLEFVSK